MNELKVTGRVLTVSESTRKRNPELYGEAYCKEFGVQAEKRPTAKRLRQSSKPLLNKLETDWYEWLKFQSLRPSVVSPSPIIPQGITFRLANGVRYTPDCFCFEWAETGESHMPTAWEVKGPQQIQDDAAAKLKMFAHEHKQIRVILVWRQDGQWLTQRILP